MSAAVDEPAFPFAASGRLWYGRDRLSDPTEQASAVARASRAAAPWLSVTWQFVGSALVGVGLGWGVDRWVGSTKGYGLVVGGLVGSALGLVAFIQGALKLLERKQ
jgi:F0F1-type ATP synthase assembly protein I